MEDIKTSTQPLNGVELTFPVPWGHIAAKGWGNPNGEPVLAVHGLQDNAASFDPLIPLLIQSVKEPLYIVSVDLPGHGLSSHLPPGVVYRLTDMMGVLQRVVTLLGWSKFIYMAHSLGALIGFQFAACYPELVNKVVAIEGLTFTMYPIYLQPNILRAVGEKLMALENKFQGAIQPRLYTKEEALERLVVGRGTRMTKTGLEVLASRNLKAEDDLVTISLDQRLKFLMFPVMDIEEYFQVLTKLRCPLLLITGNGSWIFEKQSNAENVVTCLQRSCSCFRHIIVEGDHDVHLNYPERVVPHISDFITEIKCNL